MPFVKAGGKSWIKFSNEEKLKKVGVHKDKVISYKHVLMGTRARSTSKKVVEEAMQIVVKAMGPSWKMTDEHMKDWVWTMTRRWRNLVYSWESSKRKGSAWAIFEEEEVDVLGDAFPSDHDDDEDEGEEEELNESEEEEGNESEEDEGNESEPDGEEAKAECNSRADGQLVFPSKHIFK